MITKHFRACVNMEIAELEASTRPHTFLTIRTGMVFIPI
jgi:hypothetical protein